jgi:hypothetical protein
VEVSEVRKRIRDTIERARRHAAERRARHDEATRAFTRFLDETAVPLVKQIANVLKIEGYPFTVFTPSGAVRLMSDRSADDYVEITLEAGGDSAQVVGHTSRSRGRRILEAERIVGSGDPGSITEQDLLVFLLKELEPFVEK